MLLVHPYQDDDPHDEELKELCAYLNDLLGHPGPIADYLQILDSRDASCNRFPNL